MSEQWIGSIAQVDCGNILGVFEGEISHVDNDNQTLSLINVSRNSIKCQVPEVKLSTKEIINLKLLQSTVGKSANATSIHPNNPSAFTKPIASKNCCARSSPEGEFSVKKKGEGKKKNLKRTDIKKWHKERDEACFSASVDNELLNTEFDFEKNLALFDKQAVYEEINALNKNDHVKLVDCNKRTPTKYRHDENVLNTDVPVLKQISLPCKIEKEYVTDTGLLVPSITVQFKRKLFEKAEEMGFTQALQIEMIGRAASEMVLQLLGGNYRLNPQNTHQKPTVVILCGPHVQGAQGINCGRHLSNHCVNVVILIPLQSQETNHLIKHELSLFSLTGGKTTCKITEMPSTVDFIIGALDPHEEMKNFDNHWLSNARQWAKQCKAPTLCLDPPPDFISLEQKWILSPVLPFAFKCDKSSIYISDIGIPKGIFSKIGASFSSPFGSKFIIPLYNNKS